MSLEQVLADLASRIIAPFLESGLPSPRHPLVKVLRDGHILDDMESRNLVRADGTPKQYFPTLGTFAILADDDQRLDCARLGTVQALSTLIHLYEDGDPSHLYSREEFVGHAADRFAYVDPSQVSLGLDLVGTEFGAFSGFQRSPDGAHIISFIIAEGVLKISDPESVWSSRMALSRANLKAMSGLPFVSAAAPPRNQSLPNPTDFFEGMEAEAHAEATVSPVHPRAFLSYAWESDAHLAWVHRLATRLRSDGVDVSLDQWDLEPGDNIPAFMETINSFESVVIICTPAYQDKSNKRVEGVGYESNIITTAMAEQTGDKKKYIPVLRSGTRETSLPRWLRHALSVDLRGDPYSDGEYKKLLRTLHRRKARAPRLGPIPTFDDDAEPEAPERVSRIASIRPLDLFEAGEELGIREHELLDAAAHDAAGYIAHMSSFDGESLSAGGKSFLDGANRRTRVAWLDALEKLERWGWIRALSTARDLYTVTQAGYRVSAQLGRFRRWDTTKITLLALYFRRKPDAITLDCLGVVEVPPSYYRDQVSADGTVMRSLKRDKSLWIEGADGHALDKLSWEPNQVSFLDSNLEELIAFRIHPLTPLEPDSLLLEIPQGYLESPEAPPSRTKEPNPSEITTSTSTENQSGVAFATSGKPRIMVVDDDRTIADTLAMILNQSGFEACAVYSSAEAVAYAPQFHAEMIIADVLLPELNGVDSVIQIRKMMPGIRIMLFSGQAATADILERARAKGYEFEILPKPVHPQDLMKRLRPNGKDK